MKKIKYYVRKNLISFVIGVILFGSLGVYATVTFNSKDVSYENKTSGLASNSVQGAIDELYKECTSKTAGEMLIENADLEKDEYECRFFFKGEKPNNYITFNDELWRIISVECDGKIKIMRDKSIISKAWDSNSLNNWLTPSSLNTYLNGEYLNGLKIAAQNQIVIHKWNIGSITNNNNDLANQINDENKKSWDGKIALPTVSEYLRTNSNTNCKTFNANNNNYNICKNTTWMLYSEFWWTLTSVSGNNNVFTVRYDGHLDFYNSFTSISVRPSVYLSSDIKITGGDGSQNNPYRIE